nr:hypothetical protein [Tanacetum cinerariifolium]
MVAFLKKPQGSEDFHQIVDFVTTIHIRYALTENLTIYVSLINQFWRTASVRTLDNGEIELNATIDGQVKTITEAYVRRHLKLANADGISSLPTTEIFEQLALMGYVTDFDKLTLQKALFLTILVTEQVSQGEGLTSLVGTQHTPTIIESSPHLQNISLTYRKTRTRTGRIGIRIPQSNVPSSVVDEAITKEMHDGLGKATTTAFSLATERGNGNTSRSGEGSMQYLELMEICTKLSKKVTSLENEINRTKVVYNKAIITLTKRVKKLEKKLKHKGRKGFIDSSDDAKPSLDAEDSPKQRRMIAKIDKDENVNLVKSSEQEEAHKTAEHTMESKLGAYKQSYFKGLRYEDTRSIFERVWDQNHTFAPKDSDIKKEVMKRSGFNLQQESSKKQKLDEEAEVQVDSDQEEDEMKKYIKIVPDEEIAIDAIPLATKPSVIVYWKIISERKISSYHIIRADGSLKRHSSMINLLENIDREYLETLWKLVKAKYGDTRPEEAYERVLWGDLKVMFEPDIEILLKVIQEIAKCVSIVSVKLVLPVLTNHSLRSTYDEVTYIVKSPVPPPPVLIVAVTTIVIPGATSIPVHDLGIRQVNPSIFRDSASPTTAEADVAGPSQPVGTDLSAGSFYISQDMDVETLRHAMDYEQLLAEYSVGIAHQACFSVKVRMRLEHELRGSQKLEERRAQQEAEATESIRLHSQIAAVEAAEATKIKELNSLRERNVSLEGQVAALESTVVSKDDEIASSQSQERLEEMQDEQIRVLNDHVAAIDSDLMEMVLHMDDEFYPRYLTTIANRTWILNRRLRLVLAKFLTSPKYLSAMGEAIGRAINKGMQNGLTAGIEHGRAEWSITNVATFSPSIEDDYVLPSNPFKPASCILRLSNSWFQFTRLEDQVVIEETPLSFSLEVAHSSVQRVRGDAPARRLSLMGSILPLVEPLSGRNLIGETSSFAVLATAMTTALTTTFSQTNPVPLAASISFLFLLLTTLFC